MDPEKRDNGKPEAVLTRAEQESRPAPPPETLGPVLYYTDAVLDHFSNPRNIGEMAADEAEGVIQTASAGLGQELAARDSLMSVVFRVKSDAGRGRHKVSLSGELGGPVLKGQVPEPIRPVARSGFIRVRGR